MATFPFGSILKKVGQKDISPKKVFILGVYASAVHAKWVDPDGNIKNRALAVASEPYIFWEGDGADKIINHIHLPKELGHLEPAASNLNGPSGRILNSHFLDPLGLKRDDVWLCDIIPYARINLNQKKAIEKYYNPIIHKYNLPECTIPDFRKSDLKNEARRNEIMEELEESKANILILLGDLPIFYFLRLVSVTDKELLLDFGNKIKQYGNLHNIRINNRQIEVLPLVHPRQAGRLGRHSKEWADLHEEWIVKKAPELERSILK